VEFLNKPRFWVILGVVGLAGFLLYQLWHWEVERVEVPPGKFLVKVNLWGKDLPDGEIVAPDESYKGIQQKILTEGRHFLNPLLYTYEMQDVVYVPPGQCLVVIRKFGKEIPKERLEQGDFLARDGERGIEEKPRAQGFHRLNKHAYDWKIVDAVKVGGQQIGVRTLKVGKDPRTLQRGEKDTPYLVPDGYRGVQEKPVPPETYLINPFVEDIVPVDLESVTVDFTDIYVPTRDGFIINPHVMIKYRVQPEKAPLLFVTLCDAGKLNQKHATAKDVEGNPILQKVVLPLIRGYVRIEGSKFDARDFIAESTGPRPAGDAGNARHRLQNELLTKVPPLCAEVGVIIEEIALDRLETQGELAELARQITDRELARLKRVQNESLKEQYKTEQELKASEALKQRNQLLVEADTRMKQGEIKAKQRLTVEEETLKQALQNAELQLAAAKERAKAIKATGQAEADVTTLQNEASVSGLRKAIQGFPNADAFAQYNVLMRLAPALSEIFASDTSDFAKLFSSYLTPPKGGNANGGMQK
jgi:regulator of protease activity HflC (stomatin/prohibitin superfamily)